MAMSGADGVVGVEIAQDGSKDEAEGERLQGSKGRG